MDTSKRIGSIDMNKLAEICSKYGELRATLVGSNICTVSNARTSEDTLHDAIIRVASSQEDLTDITGQVRREYNAIKKGDQIRDQRLTEYNGLYQFTETQDD